MSDYNSSLPVRTQNNGDVAAKIVDGSITSQALGVDAAGKIIVKLDDAAGNGLTSQASGAQQALDVGINVSGSQIDPRSIRPLTNADVVTAEQGTSPWITKDKSDGPVAPGTVADFSQLSGGQYNSTLPTLTNGQQAAMQLDSSGKLIVSASFGNDTNYGTVGANTLRTASEIGNATGAADFGSGATGAQTLRTAANQGAPNSLANAWPMKISDGTDSALVTGSGELNVLATAQPGVDIGDVTINNGSGGSAVNIQDGGNSITVDGTVSASNFPSSVDTAYGAVGASTLRTAAEIGNATGAADFNNGATSAQTLRVAANLAVAGANVSDSNPVPVKIEDAPGDHVNDFKDASAIAAAASDNHDYTVTALKTLHLNQIEASASGKAKMVLQVETGVGTGTFVSYFTQFNSTANPNMCIKLEDDILVAAGVRVRVVMTNKDNQAQDLYSTISGYEL
jgi:hypothetical protein